jgi:hypothetical protein
MFPSEEIWSDDKVDEIVNVCYDTGRGRPPRHPLMGTTTTNRIVHLIAPTLLFQLLKALSHRCEIALQAPWIAIVHH